MNMKMYGEVCIIALTVEDMSPLSCSGPEIRAKTSITAYIPNTLPVFFESIILQSNLLFT